VKPIHLRHESADKVVLEEFSDVSDDGRDVDSVRLQVGVREEDWRIVINVGDDHIQ